MNNETLGARILTSIENFLLEHAVLYVGLFCIAYALCVFYYRYIRINRVTNNVDMLKQYVKLERIRRKK